MSPFDGGGYRISQCAGLLESTKGWKVWRYAACIDGERGATIHCLDREEAVMFLHALLLLCYTVGWVARPGPYLHACGMQCSALYRRWWW